MRVAVIGGGVSGLRAAHALSLLGVDVVVLESDIRVGGKLFTGRVGETVVDLGADAFVVRTPHALDLCRQLELEEQLVHPVARKARLAKGRRVLDLPEGLVFGVPTDADALAESRLVSQEAVSRLSSASSLRRDAPAGELLDAGDVSIGEYLRAVLGDEIVDTLVAPFVGGVVAGDVDNLSMRCVTPLLWRAALGPSGFLAELRTLADRRADDHSEAESAVGQEDCEPTGGISPDENSGEHVDSQRPLFASLRGGMGTLAQALASCIERHGGTVACGCPVRSLRLSKGAARRWKLDTPRGLLEADGVVLATPAPTGAHLLENLEDHVAADMAELEYVSVAVIVSVHDAAEVPADQETSGFLVDPRDGLLVTACSFGSYKWPHWARADEVVLRTSVGRAGDRRHVEMDDAELVSRVMDELGELMGSRLHPRAIRIARWPNALPQFRPGHLDRVRRWREALADLPAIALCGASLGGVGIPACLETAERAAGEIADELGVRKPRR